MREKKETLKKSKVDLCSAHRSFSFGSNRGPGDGGQARVKEVPQARHQQPPGAATSGSVTFRVPACEKARFPAALGHRAKAFGVSPERKKEGGGFAAALPPTNSHAQPKAGRWLP